MREEKENRLVATVRGKFTDLIIDGLRMNDYDLSYMPVLDIEEIAIVRSPHAFLGDPNKRAIVLTMKKGQSSTPSKPIYNVKTILPLGYQKNIEFYSPKHATKSSKEDKTPDLRTTIYWNPAIAISKEGKARV